MATGSTIPSTLTWAFWNTFSNPNPTPVSWTEGIVSSLKSFSDQFGTYFNIPLFTGDFLLLGASWKLFVSTFRMVFPKDSAPPAVPAQSMGSSSGVIDLANSLKMFALIVVFSLFGVFVGNMGTYFLTLLSPLLVVVSWFFHIFGYHNAVMGVFVTNLLTNATVRLVVGLKNFAFK